MKVMTFCNEAEFVFVVVDVRVVGDKSLHETVRENGGVLDDGERAEVHRDASALRFVEGFVLRLANACKTHRGQSKPNLGSSRLEHVVVLVATHVKEAQPTIEPNLLTAAKKGTVAEVFRENWPGWLLKLSRSLLLVIGISGALGVMLVGVVFPCQLSCFDSQRVF